MTLLGVEKIDGELPYLYSEWWLTYRTGWHGILKATSLLFEYTDDPFITVGDSYESRKADVSNAAEVLEIEEQGRLTISGTSQMVKVPVKITFYNQTDHVKVSVRCVNEELEEADYKKFSPCL